MRAASVKHVISPYFWRVECDLLAILVCLIFAVLAVPLGDFAALRADSSPARAAALTVPIGDS